MIKFFGLDRQYATIRDELLDASDKVYRSGIVLDGPCTSKFETEIANRCNRKYAIAVGSGTQALTFAQNLGSIDEGKIMIPAVSFVATLNSVINSGHTAVFCDVDSNGLMDLESLDFGISEIGVDCITYVNLYGNMIDWEKFATIISFFNHDITVIEDAAQSFGAKWRGRPSGSFGDVSVLSFDPTKNLGNYGSGGMLLTDNLDAAEFFINDRDNGKLGNHSVPGTNSKMSESDCAQMLVKLSHFDKWQQRRAKIAEYYTQELSPYVNLIEYHEDVEPSWHKFVMRTEDRSALKNFLEKKGVETKIHYATPLFEHPIGWDYIDYSSEFFKETSALCAESLSLPIYPELSDIEVDHIVESVKSFY